LFISSAEVREKKALRAQREGFLFSIAITVFIFSEIDFSLVTLSITALQQFGRPQTNL
jgi:hypothetical protein